MTAQQTSSQSTPEHAQAAAELRILAIDIGGSGLKAAILNGEGELLSERHRIETPNPCTREDLIGALTRLVEPLQVFDCVSVGFPGVVRNGKIITAPNLGTEELGGFDLADALRERLSAPVRVINDADMQGCGAIEGKGLEMVITLGTGFGSALFMDGKLAPHLEIAHLPFRKGKDYDEQVGNKARKKIGKKRWNRRVQQAIETLRALTHFDMLYIGGGNASRIDFELGPDVKLISNEAGLKGGAWLWRDR
ncbi:MAG TPA: ROK family protein [Blastocatellia bacterium]|nr:ROK family protein [Blastocatellia bacterium]